MEGQIAQLLERLEADEEFAAALEDDVLATLAGAGLDDLAAEAARQRDRFDELVAQLADDDEFRQRLEVDPAAALVGWGLPEEAVEPALLAIGAPDDLVEAVSADVEGHLQPGKKAMGAAATLAVLGALAFTQAAPAASSPERAQAEAVTDAKEPNPLRYKGVEPNPLRRSGVEPNPIRYKGAAPNPFRYKGIEPNPRVRPNATADKKRLVARLHGTRIKF